MMYIDAKKASVNEISQKYVKWSLNVIFVDIVKNVVIN